MRAIAVAVATAMLLTACGGSDPAPAVGNQSGLPAPEKVSLKLGLAAFEIGTLAARVADREAIFSKYGLDVEIVQVEGDGPAAQALTAGQLDGAVMGGSPVFSAKAAGSELKVVFVTRSTPGDTLAVPVNITSGAGLRGKQIAISTFGGDSHISVIVALESLGLAATDAVIVQIGGQGDRYAALQAGAVSAAPIEGISDADLKAQGMHPLVRLSETGLKLARGVLVLPAEFIEDNPNTVLALVAALLEAQTKMIADPKLATEVFADAQDIPVAEAAPKVEPNLKFVGADGRATVAMFEPQKKALIAVNPAIADIDPASVFTNEFIDRLENEGYFDKIGVGKGPTAATTTPTPTPTATP